MIDLKPYGAFIENTIRPLIGEFKWLLNELSSRGIRVTEYNVERVAKLLLTHHLKVTLIEALVVILITLIVSLAAFKILAS